MLKIVAIGTLVLSTLDFSFQDGSCSVQSSRDGTTIRFDTNLWREISGREVGRPGGQGPPGAAGERGPPGQKGLPADQALERRYEDRIARLERRVAENAGGVLPPVGPPITSTPPPGWYRATNGFTYKLFVSSKDYPRARRACLEIGSRLASTGLRNFTVKNEIYAALNIDSHTHKYTWVGLDDLEQKHRWVWSDGVAGSSDDIDWAEFEPNNHTGDERCVHFFASNKLNDRRCRDTMMYVCERPPDSSLK